MQGRQLLQVIILPDSESANLSRQCCSGEHVRPKQKMQQ